MKVCGRGSLLVPGKNTLTIIRQRQRLSITVGVAAITRTHPHKGGQWPQGFRSSHLLSASVPHFNKFPSVSCIKRSQPAPTSPCPFFSKPLAHLSQPLHIPSHLLFLSLSLYSPLCALGCWRADPTPLLRGLHSSQPVERSGGWGDTGMEKQPKRFDLDQTARHNRFVLSPTRIIMVQTNRPPPHHSNHVSVWVPLWGLSCSRPWITSMSVIR